MFYIYGYILTADGAVNVHMSKTESAEKAIKTADNLVSMGAYVNVISRGKTLLHAEPKKGE